MKKLLITAVLPLMCLTVSAQQQHAAGENTPRRGDVTLAATVGYNSYASVQALPGLENQYEASALSTNWADKKLMVGFEGGWFFSDSWKLDWGGGLNFTNHPGYSAVPGTADAAGAGEDTTGEIPGYRAVADAYSFSYNVFAGVDRCYRLKKVPDLMLYTGVRVGFAYGLNERKYDEPESMGKSTGETWNLRAGITFGADYFLTRTFFVGIAVDPFSYTYNMTTYKPQEGLGALGADSHNYSFLAAPTLKVGFGF